MTYYEEEQTPKGRTNNARLIFLATLAASVALSIVSAYETYLGLLDFMPDGWVKHPLSVIMTFGVQVLLFAISWSIAQHLRDGWKANMPRIIIWVLCAFFSGYFSFYGFLEGTGWRDEVTREEQVLKERNRIFGGIRGDLEQQLITSDADNLLGGAGGGGSVELVIWEQDVLQTVINIARDKQPEIIASAAKRLEDLTQERNEAFAKIEQLEQDRINAATNEKLAENRLAALRASIENLSSEVQRLEPAIKAKEVGLLALEAKLADELVTGDGARARAVRLDIATTQSELTEMRLLLSSSRESLEESIAQATAIEETRKNGGATQERISIDSQIEAARARIEEINEQTNNPGTVREFNISREQQLLSSGIRALKSGKYESFETLVTQCETLRQRLIVAGYENDVAAIKCADSSVDSVVTNLDNLKAKRDSFYAQCDDNRPEPIKTQEPQTLKIDPLIIHISECVAGFAGREAREVYSADATRLLKRRGDQAQPIAIASVALLQDWQSNALMSAIFALIVDVLVLLCALVGRNVGLPETARAIDLLIGKARRPRPAIEGFERRVDLPLDEPNQMAMLSDVIARLSREGLAEFADEDMDGPDGAVLLLRNGAIKRMQQMRMLEIQDLHDQVENLGFGGDDQGSRRGRRKKKRSI